MQDSLFTWDKNYHKLDFDVAENEKIGFAAITDLCLVFPGPVAPFSEGKLPICSQQHWQGIEHTHYVGLMFEKDVLLEIGCFLAVWLGSKMKK